jgi:hypothetical protein
LGHDAVSVMIKVASLSKNHYRNQYKNITGQMSYLSFFQRLTPDLQHLSCRFTPQGIEMLSQGLRNPES